MNETPTKAPADDCGRILGDKYRLEILLGEGGFAAVYRARHMQIASLRVAVKILRAEHASNPDVVARFYQEAHTAAALRNPHTVRIMDVGQTDDARPYMVMEYVDGASLDRVLARCRTLRPISVARLAAGILRALDEAHSVGVIHRDMKPGNIMVVKERGSAHPIARVLDFGIAKVMEDAAFGLEASRATIGDNVFCTPQYAAPEVLRGEPCFQSDLYALGHMMAEMLSGRPPYWKGSPFEIAAHQLDVQPVPLGEAVLGSPLGAIITRATQKVVRGRYTSAAEMLEAIEDAYQQLLEKRPAKRRTTPVQPIAAPPPPVVDDETSSNEPPQSPQTIGALARALALEGGDELDRDDVVAPTHTLPIGAPPVLVPRSPAAPAPITPAPEAKKPVSETKPVVPAKTEAARPVLEVAEIVDLVNPVVVPRAKVTAAPTAQLVTKAAPPRVTPAAAANAAPARAVPQQRLSAPGGTPVAANAATVSLRMDVLTDDFASIAPERALRRGRAVGVAAASLLVLALVGALALLWTRVGPGAQPRGATAIAAAIAAASAATAAAALPAPEHRYTFSANVEGGALWYRGELVRPLPVFDLFCPDMRPITVEFRHPVYINHSVELDGSSAVTYRAQFRAR